MQRGLVPDDIDLVGGLVGGTAGTFELSPGGVRRFVVATRRRCGDGAWTINEPAPRK